MNRLVVSALPIILVIVTGCFNQPQVDVEATVAAAVAATLTAIPTPTPIPTDTPTSTPIPTDTPTPQPTDTPTPTLTPTPASGMIQSELANGDILYELPAEGFSIALPEAWQAVDLDKMFLAETLEAMGEQNESLKSLFTNEFFQNLAAAGIKFYAINLSPESVQGTIPATINIIRQDLPFEATLDVYTDLNVSQLDQFFELTSEIQQERMMLGEAEAMKLSYTANIVDPLGRSIEAANTQYLLVDGSLAYVVTLAMPVDLTDQLLQPSIAIVETFRLIK